MSLATDLRLLLEAAGLERVYEGFLPATPDDVIMVRGTGGLVPERTHGSEIYGRPRAQVIVRAKTYADGSARAETAWSTLFKTNAVINGRRYLSVTPIESIADLGADEQNPPRRLFSFNVQVIRVEG